MYYVYIIQCLDKSYYTGITTNIERRFFEHKEKTKQCAKYTYCHDVDKIVALWTCENRSLASQLEYRIKKLSRNQKEVLINTNQWFFQLDPHFYQRIKSLNNLI